MARSATRSGSCQGRMTAAVPRSMLGADCGQVGHQLQVVGAEGVVVEVVHDRPQDVEAGVGREAGPSSQIWVSEMLVQP